MPNSTPGNDTAVIARGDSAVMGRAQTSLVLTGTEDIDRVNASGDGIELRLSGQLSKQIMAQVAPNDRRTVAKFVNDSVAVYLQLAALRHFQGELFCRTPETGELRRIVLPYEQATENTPQNAKLDHDQLVANSVNKVQK